MSLPRAGTRHGCGGTGLHSTGEVSPVHSTPVPREEVPPHARVPPAWGQQDSRLEGLRDRGALHPQPHCSHPLATAPTPRRGCARPGAPFPPSCRAKGHRAGQGGGNCALSQQQESKQEREAESNKPQVRAAPRKLVLAEVGWGGDLLRPSLWRSKAEPWSPIPINSQPV